MDREDGLAEREDGAVLGAILGELDELDGDVLGAVLGAVKREMRKRHHHDERHIRKADWRGHELAPGVNAPGEGNVPLPLLAQVGTGPGGGGIFSTGATPIGPGAASITFAGQLQKPFKGERLFATTQRQGATATGLLLGQMFMGVDLQQATIQSFDVEAYGAPTSFDSSMRLMQGPPGIIFQMLINPSLVPTTPDFIFLVLSIRGHVVH
jgi:hypothetical protein